MHNSRGRPSLLIHKVRKLKLSEARLSRCLNIFLLNLNLTVVPVCVHIPPSFTLTTTFTIITVPFHRFLLLQCIVRVDDNHKEIRGRYSRCFRPEPGYGRDYSKHSPVKPQIKLVDLHITDNEANYLINERHTFLLIRYSRNVDAARDGNTLALLLSLFIRRMDKTHYLAA